MEPVGNNNSVSQTTKTFLRLLGDFRERTREINQTLRAPRNQTFVSNSQKDRVNPPDLKTAQTVIDPNDTAKSLASSPNLSRVQSGQIRINNVPIAVDPVADSFREIVSRINGSGAGIEAFFDSGRNELVIYATNGSSKIEITEDTSNFLEEVNVSLGSYNASTTLPNFRNPGNNPRSSDITNSISSFSETFNAIPTSDELSTKLKQEFVDSVKNIVTNNFQENLSESSFEFNLSNNIQLDIDLLQDFVDGNPEFFASFLSGDNGFSQFVTNRVDNFLQQDPGSSLDVTA